MFGSDTLRRDRRWAIRIAGSVRHASVQPEPYRLKSSRKCFSRCLVLWSSAEGSGLALVPQAKLHQFRLEGCDDVSGV